MINAVICKNKIKIFNCHNTHNGYGDPKTFCFIGFTGKNPLLRSPHRLFNVFADGFLLTPIIYEQWHFMFCFILLFNTLFTTMVKYIYSIEAQLFL